MDDGGTTQIVAGAVLDISGTASKVMAGGRKLENLGTVDWTSGDITGTGGVTIDNQNMFRMSGDVNLVDGLNGGPQTFFNTGTIIRDTTDGVASIDFSLNNDGTTTISIGTLELGGFLGMTTGSSHGSFLASPNTTLQFSGGSPTLEADSLLDSAGNVIFLSGNAAIAGSYRAEHTKISGGTQQFNSALATTTTATLMGGELAGTGVFQVDQSMDWTDG